MKTKYILIATAFTSLLGLASSASAFVRPGWDRPIFRADMSILNEQGNPPPALATARNVELVMTQQDGTPSATGFVLLIDGQASDSYEVTSISKDRCGSTVYTLVPIQGSGNYVLSQSSQKLQVTDHSDGVCMSFHRYRWELNVENLDLTHQAVGQLRMVGNPESVITPQ